MIAVITGDIIASRKLLDQNKWLLPLKELFNQWGKTPKDWLLERGDFFQVELAHPEEALLKALEIKALIKQIKPEQKGKTMSDIDVRLALGIGIKTFSGESIAESNGPAFIFSGEKFDTLKKGNVTLAIQSSWKDFDEEINLYLKLAGIFMDKWSVSSAELMALQLKNPNITQEEMGKHIGINQSGISRRWNRANISEVLEINKMFEKKIKMLLQ